MARRLRVETCWTPLGLKVEALPQVDLLDAREPQRLCMEREAILNLLPAKQLKTPQKLAEM